MDKAILDIIRENLDPQGQLPEGYALPGSDTRAGCLERFMAWLWGIGGVLSIWRPKPKDILEDLLKNRVTTRYYIREGMEHRLAEKIVRAVRADIERGSDSRKKIAARLRGCGTYFLMQRIMFSLTEEDIETRRMEPYARGLLFQSGSVELVQLGITLLGPIHQGDPAVRQAVAALGLCDEFVRTVCLAFGTWKDARGNDVIFSVAQKLHGDWRKKQLNDPKRLAVNQLKPETEEIRRWLLCHGWNCCTPPRLHCAIEGNMIGALRQETLDDELYDGIAAIIDLLLVEIDRNGISAYGHAEEALSRYLHFAGRHCKTLQHLLYMLNLWDWFEALFFQGYEVSYDGSDLPGEDEVRVLTHSETDALWSLCAEMIHRPHWAGVIREALAGADSDERERAREAASRLEALYYNPEEGDNHA